MKWIIVGLCVVIAAGIIWTFRQAILNAFGRFLGL